MWAGIVFKITSLEEVQRQICVWKMVKWISFKLLIILIKHITSQQRVAIAHAWLDR